MQRAVSVHDARQRLDELIDGVYYCGDEVVIERGGKPIGGVIPIERYRLWQMIEEIHADNEGVDPDQVERDVAAAVDAVRAEQRREVRERCRHMWDELKQQGSDLDPEEAERLALDEIAAYREERQRAAPADQE